MPSLTVSDIHELAMSLDVSDRLRAARMKRCPADDLTRMTRDPDYRVKKIAWANPNLPHRTILLGLKEAVERRSWVCIYGLLKNTSVTSDDLRDITLPAFLAHPNYPQDLMMNIALNGTTQEKEHLARNPRLPQEIQDVFIANPYAGIRRRLAKNRHISVTSVEALINDPSPSVLRDLIGYKLAAPYRDTILGHLMGHNMGVRNIAHIARYTQDTDFIASAAQHTSRCVYENALRNESTSEETLGQVCMGSDEEKRRLAARNPNCPEEWQVAAALH